MTPSVAAVPSPSALEAVLVLGAGAVLVLLVARPLSTRPFAAAATGALFAIVAGASVVGGEVNRALAFDAMRSNPNAIDGAAGVQVGPVPASTELAILALCIVAAIALLLVPALELQVSAHIPESTALLLLGTSGAVALAAAADLLQAVVGLETLALSAATLVALGRGERPLEAAFKYFVLGAISLAALLYGVGLIYLGTGSFAFPSAAQLSENGIVLAGAVLVALGFAFELAVFPLHWGALDAYTAAAPGLAGYVMSASKLAAAFALGRLVVAAGMPVAQVLVWVGVLTIVWGTFGALAQRNLRRMLAYSAVTHAGFIALAAGSGPRGPVTAAFYAAVYGGMAMLAFAALAGHPRGEWESGVPPSPRTPLGPVRASALALGLFSLSGIPPTPGFWAKLAVLVAAWQSAGPIATLIAAAGGVFSVLYYLRPLPDLFAEMKATAPAGLARPVAVPAVLLATIMVAALGLFPNLAWTLARGFPPGT